MSPRRRTTGGLLLAPFRTPFTGFWLGVALWFAIFLFLRWVL